MNAKSINGRKIAEKIRNDVSKEVSNLYKKHGKKPNIVSVMVGENKESNLYLKLRDKACEQVGISSSHINFSADSTEAQVIDKISKLNNDSTVHGILVQLPLPKHISANKIFEILKPCKDVEGFTAENIGRMLLGDEFIIPCTPLAVLKILEHEKVELKGKDVVIINHSTVVGKPLSALFLNRDASVSVVHVFTKDLRSYSKKADILVSATGVAGIIKKDHVKPGAFIIDVGIIQTESGVVGDLDKTVEKTAGKITPVPGGVGPVTVACSLLNMLKTYKNCIK
jgi:methylenetetrahydrofolate dehydrogenase (NADP+) / methenyltetrahydrofolate cyclohydrolase